MTKVKRNHHLPRFYLNAWADPKGQVALRRRGEKQGILTSVGNVGVVNGLHNPRAESLLGRTETAAAPVIKSLLADTDALGRWKNRRVLARFMAELMARQPYMATFRGLSPKTYENILDVSEDARAILRILCGEYGPNIQFEDAKGIQGDIKEIQDGVSKRWPDMAGEEIKEKMREMAADPQANQQLRSLVIEYPESVALLERFGGFWPSQGWLVCESTGIEFITSDQPVFRHPKWLDRNGIAPQDTICFVVSPTILLKVGTESGKCKWDEREVHKINLYIAEHCDHQIISTPSNNEYLNRIRMGKYRPWAHARFHQPPQMLARVAS